MASPLSAQNVYDALRRIRSHVRLTPVITNSEINKRTQREIFFKCEHLQSTGSFKARGACNAIFKILETSGRDCKGIISHSSGNHGQAVAWASKKAGYPCTIVVPEGTPQGKCEAITGYGANLVFCEPTPIGRQSTVDKIMSDTSGIRFVSPYEQSDVMAGQGTSALELLTEVPDLDAIVVTVSGGGLSSGIAVMAKAINPDIKIILVAPEGKNLQKCLETGERLWPNPPQFLKTIAEGIKTQQVGHNTFPILCQLAEKEVIEVSDNEMIDGMKFSFHWMKQVIEAAGGAAIAALFTDKFRQLPSSVKKIGVILCGGNVDIDNLPWTDNFKAGY